jgi:hypothetical protein
MKSEGKWGMEVTLGERIDSRKNTLERQTARNRENSSVSKREVGLDVLIVTVRSSLHLGQAHGFEAPVAAAGTV